METFANQALTFTDGDIIVKTSSLGTMKEPWNSNKWYLCHIGKGGSGRRSQTKNRQNDGGATRCHFKGANTRNYRLSQLFSPVWKWPNSPLLSSNLPDWKQFEVRKNLRTFQLPEPFFCFRFSCDSASKSALIFSFGSLPHLLMRCSQTGRISGL